MPPPTKLNPWTRAEGKGRTTEGGAKAEVGTSKPEGWLEAWGNLVSQKDPTQSTRGHSYHMASGPAIGNTARTQVTARRDTTDVQRSAPTDPCVQPPGLAGFSKLCLTGLW